MRRKVVLDQDHIDDSVESADRGVEQREPSSDGEAEEAQGDLKKDFREDKLMHTVLQADSEIDTGKLVRESANQNVGAFSPELMFQNIVNNYREAERLMGDTLIRQITGYNADYVERNVNIPEFQRELRDQIKQNVDDLREQEVLNSDYQVAERGVEAAALNLIDEEFERLRGSGSIGERDHDRRLRTGKTKGYTTYASSQPYSDISTRRTVKVAARRGRQAIHPVDLRLEDRRSVGSVEIMLCIDTSGSMTGEKMEAAKRTGVALSYQADRHGDDAGIVLFSSSAYQSIPLGADVVHAAERLATASPSGETDIGRGVADAIPRFTNADGDKQIIIVSDGLQTKGASPEDEVLPVVERARSHDIRVSVVGVDLDEPGRRLGEAIVERGGGRLYFAQTPDETDTVVLEAYSDVRKHL